MKKMMTMAVCSFLALTVLVGCESSENSEDVIKLGVNYETTGGAATYGQDHVDGIQLAIDEINDKGGIDGKKIELVIKDNKSDTGEVINVSTTLITEDEVVAILGPATTAATKSAISVANKNKVPTISASATADDVTFNKDGSVTPYGFKICYSDSFQGTALAKFAASEGYTKAVILGDSSNDYAKGLSSTFTKEFTANGGTIVASESYGDKDSDFSAQITKIKDLDFDVLFVPGYYEGAGPIIKQARQAGIEQVILGPDGFDSATLAKLAGKANTDNVFFSTHFSRVEKNDKVDDFVKKFKKEYDKEPGCFNALGYDLAYYMADAIKRCEGDVTAENITKALSDTKVEFAGVTGNFTMGEDHTAQKSIKVVGLKNGKQVTAVEVK